MMRHILELLQHQFCKSGFLLLGMFATAVGFVLCFSYSTSPVYFHDGYDSAVFQTMGLALLHGKLPYVDLFDHKGPVLYFINAFGLWLGNGKLGIFVMQIIANTISFTFIYKTIRLFHNIKCSIAVFIGSVLLYAYFYGEGNLCEEWMLCFTTPALYLAIRNILSPPTAKYLLVDSAFYGFCLAICFMIRPNDAVIHIGGLMFGTFLWMLINKHYLQAWQNVIVMGLSFIMCVVPTLFFFAWNDALSAMWYGLISYNMQYAGDGVLSSVASVPKIVVFAPLLLVAIFVGIKRESAILFVLITQILLAWLLLGGRMYRHYWICVIPLFSLYGVAGFYWKKVTTGIVVAGLTAMLLLVVCKPKVIHMYYHKVNDIVQTYIYKQSLVHGFYAEADKLFSYVPTDEQDKIWNYNLGWQIKPYFSVFYHHGVVQQNKIPLYQMCFADEELRNSDDVKVKFPKWIMLSRDESLYWLYDERQEQDAEFIIANYDCVAKTNPEICEIELWKRKL